MFLVSVLSVGLIKKEFMSIWGRKSKNLFLEYFMEDLILVAECISNAFRVSWAYVIFSNSGWDCRCGDHSQKNTLGKMNGAKNLIQN